MIRDWDAKIPQDDKDALSDYELGMALAHINQSKEALDTVMQKDFGDEVYDKLREMIVWCIELKEELDYEMVQRLRGRGIMKAREEDK